MVFTLHDRKLAKVGVVGSGQIGPDIALYFTKALAPYGVRVVVVDILNEALEAGRKKVGKKISKGVETGAFKPEQAKAMLDNLTFTSDYDALTGAGLVIEAATENPTIKRKIVSQLESICGSNTILASNSSHMEPEVIFSEAKNPGRCLVIHYFFPAERNMVVEIVPGKETDPGIAEWLLEFYEAIGKAPIQVKSRYGYAVDPIFEGMFQAAALGVEADWGTVKQVDTMVQKALGLGVGSFTAMNLTGGNPITAHGLEQFHEKNNKWFRKPKILADQMEKNEPWETAGRGEKVEFTDEQYGKVKTSMMGAYFGLVGQVIDSGITNVADLEMAVEVSLVVRAPFAWMNKVGTKEALRLVEGYAKEHPDFPVPSCLKKLAETGEPWEIPMVLRKDVEGVAVIKIRRPKVLNALNLEVFHQLRMHCEDAAKDPNIKGIVITGFGSKAFVSGADINMLARIKTPTEGEENSRQFHQTLNFIEDIKKPVVCAMNGMALGGGNELAMACHARIAKKGLKFLASQPEVNLGIIPGAGGTQRLPRLIGLEAAAKIMRTARPISSSEALELGLISEEVEGNLVGRAVELTREYASGKKKLQLISRTPMDNVPDKLGDLNLGHLSKATDAILCQAILEGAKKTLREGLSIEIKAFGKCVETEDMKIGMENFLKNGPRVKAKFCHQ